MIVIRSVIPMWTFRSVPFCASCIHATKPLTNCAKIQYKSHFKRNACNRRETNDLRRECFKWDDIRCYSVTWNRFFLFWFELPQHNVSPFHSCFSQFPYMNVQITHGNDYTSNIWLLLRWRIQIPHSYVLLPSMLDNFFTFCTRKCWVDSKWCAHVQVMIVICESRLNSTAYAKSRIHYGLSFKCLYNDGRFLFFLLILIISKYALVKQVIFLRSTMNLCDPTLNWP